MACERQSCGVRTAQLIFNITMADLVKKLKDQVFRKKSSVEDWLFDFYHGIETLHLVPREQFVTKSESLQYANCYHGVWCSNLKTLINEAKSRGYKTNRFLDVGSGKGKACFYASEFDHFTEVEGIEFDPKLLELSNKNLKSFSRDFVKVISNHLSNIRIPK
jgi:protein-L-isoaspartate O-methyltransferase